MSTLQSGMSDDTASRSSERLERLGSVWRQWGVLLLVLIGCFLTQTLAASMRFWPTQLSPIWFPGGILIAALLLSPPRRWGLVLLAGGAGLIAASGMTFAGAVVRCIPILAGFVIEAVFLQWALPDLRRLNSLRGAAVFLLGTLLGSVLIALMFAITVQTFGNYVWIGTSLPALFLMDVLGQITLAPPILLAAEALSRGRERRPTTAARVAEAFALAASLLLVGQVAFGGLLPGIVPSPALIYAPLPLLLWAAVRFGLSGIGLAVLVVAFLSTRNAIDGRGPFITEAPDANILTLQCFLLVISTPLLGLAALVRKRGDATAALRDRECELRHRFAQLSATYRDAPVGLAFVGADVRYINVNDRLAEMIGYRADALVGRTPRETLPDLADELEARYRRVLTTGEPNVDVEVHGMTAAQPGVERDWLMSHRPVRDDQGEIIGVSTVVQEVTERKWAEAKIKTLLVELEKRISALHEAGRVLQDDRRTPDEWLHALSALLPGVWSPRREASVCVRWGDRIGATPVSPGPPTWRQCANFTTADGTTGCVEVTYRGVRSGVEEGPLTDEEQHLLEALAEMLCLALDRRLAEEALRQSYKRIQDLTRRVTDVEEAERAHLARELHDEIGQSLTSLKMTLAGGYYAPATPLSDGAALRRATDTVDDLIRRVREISVALRPPHLDLLGLLPTLTWHTLRYTEQTGIHVALRHHGMSRRFSPRVELATYRIVQEALTNVARHAGVSEAVVRVWANDGALFLQVEDAGNGFDSSGAARQRQGIGLLGMEERARLLGGSLAVESAPGQGTTVRAELPLESDTREKDGDREKEL